MISILIFEIFALHSIGNENRTEAWDELPTAEESKIELYRKIISKLFEIKPDVRKTKKFGEVVKNLLFQTGVGMRGTLVPMSTGVPAGIHKNFKNLGTVGYRVPRKF